eukprot:TRINITY_DN1368_c0_g1_i6.p1 TRINITY_DN1368_c0_g1~~TRINITY_DN1368_c0_g1_i6.p1  ORF type:complete len:220 (+),score=25.53 TRINITY_DN1368_c0_g1_i6:450-1109(+)
MASLFASFPCKEIGVSGPIQSLCTMWNGTLLCVCCYRGPPTVINLPSCKAICILWHPDFDFSKRAILSAAAVGMVAPQGTSPISKLGSIWAADGHGTVLTWKVSQEIQESVSTDELNDTLVIKPQGYYDHAHAELITNVISACVPLPSCECSFIWTSSRNGTVLMWDVQSFSIIKEFTIFSNKSVHAMTATTNFKQTPESQLYLLFVSHGCDIKFLKCY